MNRFYDEQFYKTQRTASYRSARSVVPILIELARPRSVVDFGCGVGTWLKVFVESGIEDVLGLEGEWALANELEIERSLYRISDLTKPVQLERTFDLAICLEVAEHLPKSSSAILVESLTKAAPVVVFSAAIPGQGGTDHINEQWQDFWVAEFAKLNFQVADVIRPKIWRNPDIEFYYRQNALMFAAPGLNLRLQLSQDWTFNRIHEEAFERKTKEIETLKKLAKLSDIGSGKASLRALSRAIGGLGNALKRRIGFKG